MLCNAMAAAVIDLVDYKSRAVVHPKPIAIRLMVHALANLVLMMLLSELSSSGS